MLKTSSFLVLCICSASAVLFSCSSTNNAETPTAAFTRTGNTVNVSNLDATSEERFTLVNLQTQSIVPLSDSATTKWDIGFRKTTIIVNGGKLRKGTGGIQRLQNQTFDALKEAPQSGYRGDDAEDNLALTAKSGESWYLYSGTSITPIKDVVLVIRTGDGKNFAKMEVQSYYKDKVEPSITAPSRYYALRYQVQTNGTREFR